MLMKKLFTMLIFLALLTSVLAQTDETVEDSTDVVLETDDSGINPDSVLYGLDTAFERLRLALTFNKEKKARRELEISKERLKEMRLMIAKNKLEDAEKAREKHQEIIEKLKLRLENDVEGDDDELETKVEIKGELTEEQKQRIINFLDNIKARNIDVRLKIDARLDKIKIKLRENGVDETEIETEIEEKRDTGLENAFENRIE